MAGFLLVAAALGLARPAAAQIGSERYASIVVDAQSGTVLVAASPDELRHPASLTKMMTVYMAFEALREGRISMGSEIPVSASAASMPPSRLGLVAGTTLTVEEAILALVTKSANDAAAALGEFLGGGSEYRFAQMMTLRARALGMTRTTFRNASGLPDVEQVSTARDMALLGQRLVRDFPDRYALFSTYAFNWRGRTVFNHNRLLNEYEGADGIKTGYVNDSGFNLVASARRDGVRLVAAVFGGRTGRERDRHMMAILDQGFETMGVAPRAPGAMLVARAEPPPPPPVRGRAGGFSFMGSAHAAALPPRERERRGPERGPALATARPVPAAGLLRLAATRPSARIPQGDAGLRGAPAATAGRPVAATRPTARSAPAARSVQAAAPAPVRRRS